jgi:hypothetical protein
MMGLNMSLAKREYLERATQVGSKTWHITALFEVPADGKKNRIAFP